MTDWELISSEPSCTVSELPVLLSESTPKERAPCVPVAVASARVIVSGTMWFPSAKALMPRASASVETSVPETVGPVDDGDVTSYPMN